MEGTRATAVTRQPSDTGTSITIAGALDAAAAPEVRLNIATAMVAGGVIEVDVTAVTCADPAGVRALTDLRDCAVNYGAEVRVTAADGSVQRIVDLSDGSLLGDRVQHTA